MLPVRNLKIFVSAVALVGAFAGTAAASSLYAINDDGNSLVRIDPVTLAVTTVGATGIAAGEFGDLAFDEVNQIMYWVAGRGNNNLYTINLLTGAATLVGAHGIEDEFALGYDGTNLYGQSTTGSVQRLNTANAAPTVIGSNTVYPGGYDWNSTTNQMVLLSAGPGSFFTINLTTGAATLLNAGAGFVNDADLAYDRDRNAYWAIDYSGNLFFYDSAFARTTKLSGLAPYAALEYVSDAAVPEPASLLLLGTGLVAVAARRWRRGRKAA